MRRAVWISSVLLAATLHAQSVPPRHSLDHEALAKKIIERLDMKEGETFLAVAHPGLFDEMIPYLRYEAMRVGAVDLGVLDVLAQPVPASFREETLRAAAEASLPRLREMLEGVDASVMLPGANPGQPAYAAIQDLLRAGKGRTIHFHWLENGSALPLPGQPLPPRHVIEATYQRALLEVDYEALAAHQRRFVAALRTGEVHVTSAGGTDLRFRIGDRPVNVQDGNASRSRAESGRILIDREIELPAGAVRVAPLEETVHGTIAFPPSQWDGRPVQGLKLVFEAGRVVSVSAESGEDAVRRELDDAGDGGASFREVALGFHPLLAVPEENPWIPYYGYGAGVVRLSLGDNSELGGNVTGGYVRWNFFVDTTLTVAGEVWVRDGTLVR